MPRLEGVEENFEEIISKSWHVFGCPETTSQRTTFTTRFATNPPQKHHNEIPLFPKPPSKTPANPRLSHPPPVPDFF
jgi:hypothetical protein